MFEQIIATSPRGHCQRSLARSLAGWLVSQKGLFHFEIYNCYPISSIHLNPTYHPCPSNNIIHFHLLIAEVWDDWVQAVDQGNAAAEWLSTVLQVPKLRLVPWIA